MLWGFRVDTNNNSGLGHVSRMLSIAEVFKEKEEIVFIVNNINDRHCSHIKNLNYRFLESRSLSSVLDVCLLDGYFFKSKEIEFLRNKSKKIIQIDDFDNNFKYTDQTINFLSKDAENVVVSNKFFEKDFFKIKKNVSNILITFGMADNTNATLLTLDAIKIIETYIKANIYISLPTKNKYHKKIRNSIFNLRNVKEVKEYKQDQFRNLLRNIDFSIGSGGVTLNEVLSMGIPTIVLATAENQKKKIYNLFEKGLINYCGFSKSITKYKLANRILKLYFSFSERRRMFTNSSLVFSKKKKKDFIFQNIIRINGK